ncbi:Hydrophobic surface binding protein A domain containing protein [Tylopilus felleus]
MFFRLSFVTLILAVGALGTPVIRDSDAGQVEADIKVLIEKARALDQSVKAFPKTGGTMEEVYQIHVDAINLDNAIKAATEHASASAPFTDAQANNIIGLMTSGILPVVNEGLDDLIAKKDAIAAFYATGIARSDLGILKTDTDKFGQAIWANTPADKQDTFEKVINTLDVDFSAASKAYST